jgi:hypothetical protein
MPISSLTPLGLARALGGDPLRDGALVPGPGHPPHDRSLRVWLDAAAPDGFRVHSFGRECDDPLRCRDHVRDTLGLAPWRPGGASVSPKPRPRPISDPGALGERSRKREKARWLWDQSRAESVTLVDYLESRGIHISQLPATLRYLAPRLPKESLINPADMAHWLH